MPQAVQVETGFVTTAQSEGTVCPTEGEEGAPPTPADDVQGGSEEKSLASAAAAAAAVISVSAAADAVT